MPTTRSLDHDLETVRAAAAQAMETIGALLAQARRDARYSMRQLAALTGVRADVIQRIERGVWIPTADELDLLRLELAEWLPSQ